MKIEVSNLSSCLEVLDAGFCKGFMGSDNLFVALLLCIYVGVYVVLNVLGKNY